MGTFTFDGEDAMSVTFMDTDLLARSGYGMTSMLMSGLANFVRSPRDTERSAGRMMPTYREFTEDIKSSIVVYKLEGDDLILRSTTDRSATVSVAATIGMLKPEGEAIAWLAELGLSWFAVDSDLECHGEFRRD